MAETQVDTPLTIREKMTIHLLLVIVKVIKPFGWSHEIDNTLKEFKELLNKE